MTEAQDVVLLLKQDYDYRFYPEDKNKTASRDRCAQPGYTSQNKVVLLKTCIRCGFKKGRQSKECGLNKGLCCQRGQGGSSDIYHPADILPPSLLGRGICDSATLHGRWVLFDGQYCDRQCHTSSVWRVWAGQEVINSVTFPNFQRWWERHLQLSGHYDFRVSTCTELMITNSWLAW